jgi:hypothetical protein
MPEDKDDIVNEPVVPVVEGGKGEEEPEDNKINDPVRLVLGEIGEMGPEDEFMANLQVKSFAKKPGISIAVTDITDLGAKSKHAMGPVVLSTDDAKNRWKALEGMPVHVDAASGFSHHWPSDGGKIAIGTHIATQAEERSGGKVRIRAALALWEHDYPDIVAALRDFRPQMGASYEVLPDYTQDDAVEYGDDGVVYINHYSPVGSALVRRNAAAHPNMRLISADDEGATDDGGKAVENSDVTVAKAEPKVDDLSVVNAAAKGNVSSSPVKRQTHAVRKGGKVDLLDQILKELPEDKQELAATILDRVVADRVREALQEKIVPLQEACGRLKGERHPLEQEKVRLEAKLNARKASEEEAVRKSAVASKVDEWVKSGKYRKEDIDKLTPIASKLIAGELLAAEEVEAFADLRHNESEPLTTITADSHEETVTSKTVDAYRKTLVAKGMRPSKE